ncbi:helix-turn-helix domain-containing protein [Actinoplanes sp. NPDC049596]|uniref:helix-turn-helix domain-containing protein n=1 Tax=unclassified Actinoplanes TaxID=2626549 RepID=UPI00343EF74A
MTFAALIRSHRRAARMTLRDLADASGVSARAISDMERGHSTVPQRRTLDALAAALALDPSQRHALIDAARSSRSHRPYAPPRAVPDFTGRAAELAVLVSAGAPVLIHGQPGVGKTALAVHAASLVPGPVHFHDLRNPLPAVPDGQLLILDNASSVHSLPPLPPRVWITSRRALSGLPGVTRLPLPPLPPADSVTLLTAITGTPDPAAVQVADYCAHLPLALRIAGNRVAGRPGWTMSHLAQRLTDETRRLSALTAGDLSLEATLAQAFGALSPRARDLCRAAAQLPIFDAVAAAELTGWTLPRVAGAIAELLDHNLIHPAANRYRHYALIRLYAMITSGS